MWSNKRHDSDLLPDPRPTYYSNPSTDAGCVAIRLLVSQVADGLTPGGLYYLTMKFEDSIGTPRGVMVKRSI